MAWTLPNNFLQRDQRHGCQGLFPERNSNPSSSATGEAVSHEFPAGFYWYGTKRKGPGRPPRWVKNVLAGSEVHCSAPDLDADLTQHQSDSLDADAVSSAEGLERDTDSPPASEIPDDVSDGSRDDETDSDNESIAPMEEVPADTPLSPTDCQQWEDDPESTGHDCQPTTVGSAIGKRRSLRQEHHPPNR